MKKRSTTKNTRFKLPISDGTSLGPLLLPQLVAGEPCTKESTEVAIGEEKKLKTFSAILLSENERLRRDISHMESLRETNQRLNDELDRNST